MKPNENEFTLDGIEYAAFASLSDLCSDCAFEFDRKSCSKAPACTHDSREDCLEIIFKRKE